MPHFSYRLRKYSFTVSFVLVSLLLSALNSQFNDDSIPAGKALIYGNFIQRLGFSSGGLQQNIRIINLDTKEVFKLVVKETFTSAKENFFSFILKPGTYAIIDYNWGKSKWYGAKFTSEPIVKGVNTTDSLALQSGKTMAKNPGQFKFTIAANTLYYVGTWHFDTERVYFTDDKSQLDAKAQKNLKKLNLAAATTIIPD